MHAGINHSAEHLDPAFPPLPVCPPRYPPAGLPSAISSCRLARQEITTAYQCAE